MRSQYVSVSHDHCMSLETHFSSITSQDYVCSSISSEFNGCRNMLEPRYSLHTLKCLKQVVWVGQHFYVNTKSYSKPRLQ